MVGGVAGLAQAMLAAAGIRLVHVSGLAVNRARQGTAGGENKSDPRDARVIADQVRTRRDLRPIEGATELDAELRLLAGRRRDLVEEQTRRLARLHDLLAGSFPGLERVLDLTTKGGLWLLTRYATPAELRAAGRAAVAAHLTAAGGLPRAGVARVATAVLAAAEAQRIAVPGERTVAALIRELAAEALACRERLGAARPRAGGRPRRHPDAALIRSLPGMGPILTAELIAEAGDLARFRSADALAAGCRAGARPAPVGQGALPAPRHGGQQGAEVDLLPGRLLLPAGPGQPCLLRPQAPRGQAPPPGRHRPGAAPRQRALGAAPLAPTLSARPHARRLTNALGCPAEAHRHLGDHRALAQEAQQGDGPGPHGGDVAAGGDELVPVDGRGGLPALPAVLRSGPP